MFTERQPRYTAYVRGVREAVSPCCCRNSVLSSTAGLILNILNARMMRFVWDSRIKQGHLRAQIPPDSWIVFESFDVE